VQAKAPSEAVLGYTARRGRDPPLPTVRPRLHPPREAGPFCKASGRARAPSTGRE